VLNFKFIHVSALCITVISLAAWSRKFLMKRIFAHLVKKSHAFPEKQPLITVVTKAHYRILYESHEYSP